MSVTRMEELKYLRLIPEDEYAVKNEENESIDIDISEMDLSPPEQFTKYESVVSRDYQQGTASYYVLENSFNCNVNMDNLAFLLYAVLGNKDGNIIYGTNSSLLPSYTVQGGYGTYEKEILGMVLDTLSLEVESEFITASAEIKSKIDSKQPLKDLAEFDFDQIPLSFYHVDSVKMRREDEQDFVEMRCKTNKINLEIKNNVNTEDARGMGNRFMCKTPRASRRELGLTLTVDDNDQKYLEMYWGSDEGPRKYLAGEEFELMFYIRNGNRKFELYFPKCVIRQPSATANNDPLKYELSIDIMSKTVPAAVPYYGGLAGAMFARIADSDPNPKYDVEFNLVDEAGTSLSDSVTVKLKQNNSVVSTKTSSTGSITFNNIEDGKYDIEVTSSSKTVESYSLSKVLVDGASKTRLMTVILSDGE